MQKKNELILPDDIRKVATNLVNTLILHTNQLSPEQSPDSSLNKHASPPLSFPEPIIEQLPHDESMQLDCLDESKKMNETSPNEEIASLQKTDPGFSALTNITSPVALTRENTWLPRRARITKPISWNFLEPENPPAIKETNWDFLEFDENNPFEERLDFSELDAFNDDEESGDNRFTKAEILNKTASSMEIIHPFTPKETPFQPALIDEVIHPSPVLASKTCIPPPVFIPAVENITMPGASAFNGYYGAIPAPSPQQFPATMLPNAVNIHPFTNINALNLTMHKTELNRDNLLPLVDTPEDLLQYEEEFTGFLRISRQCKDTGYIKELLQSLPDCNGQPEKVVGYLVRIIQYMRKSGYERFLEVMESHHIKENTFRALLLTIVDKESLSTMVTLGLQGKFKHSKTYKFDIPSLQLIATNFKTTRDNLTTYDLNTLTEILHKNHISTPDYTAPNNNRSKRKRTKESDIEPKSDKRQPKRQRNSTLHTQQDSSKAINKHADFSVNKPSNHVQFSLFNQPSFTPFSKEESARILQDFYQPK